MLVSGIFLYVVADVEMPDYFFSFHTAVWLSGSSDVVRTKFSSLSVAIDVGLVRLSAWVRFSNPYVATDVDPKSVHKRKTWNTVSR